MLRHSVWVNCPTVLLSSLDKRQPHHCSVVKLLPIRPFPLQQWLLYRNSHVPHKAHTLTLPSWPTSRGAKLCPETDEERLALRLQGWAGPGRATAARPALTRWRPSPPRLSGGAQEGSRRPGHAARWPPGARGTTKAARRHLATGCGRAGSATGLPQVSACAALRRPGASLLWSWRRLVYSGHAACLKNVEGNSCCCSCTSTTCAPRPLVKPPSVIPFSSWTLSSIMTIYQLWQMFSFILWYCWSGRGQVAWRHCRAALLHPMLNFTAAHEELSCALYRALSNSSIGNICVQSQQAVIFLFYYKNSPDFHPPRAHQDIDAGFLLNSFPKENRKHAVDHNRW